MENLSKTEKLARNSLCGYFYKKIIAEIYSNGYKREHSDYLNNIFDIKPNGVDYYNQFNISFEFKESYMKKEKGIFYKIPKHQLIDSDYFIFSINNTMFYLVDKRDIQENFSCKNKSKLAHVRINTVKLLSIYSNENILLFKQYIDLIKEVDK